MLEQLIAAIAGLTVALTSLAKAVAGAKVTDAPAAPAKAASVEDDLGLGDLGTTAEPEKPITQEDFYTAIKAVAGATGGREKVKAALKKVKADQVKDVKAEDYKKVLESLK